MSKRFRCGRLMFGRNGKVRKMNLARGGGTRFCEWNNSDMNFKDVHQSLLNIFNIQATKFKTSLYDFQLKRLDVNQYNTFSEYIQKYGLSSNNQQVNNQPDIQTQPNKKNQRKKQARAARMTLKIEEMKPLVTETTPRAITWNQYEPVLKIELDEDDEEEENHQTSSNNTYAGYSFKESSNTLMMIVWEFISDNSFDQILIQLFEYTCSVQGYVCLTIDPLKQKMSLLHENIQSIDKADIEWHSHSLDNINNICKSIKKLLGENMDKFGPNEIYSTFNEKFSQFHDNLKILRHQWYEFVKVYNGSSEHLPPSIHSVESIIPTVPHSVESIASTVSRSDNQSVSEDHSELIFQTKKKNDVLFKRSLKCFKQLLDAIKYLQLPTVNSLIISMVGEIKSIESNIDLADTQSIDDALKAIVSLKKRIIIKFKPESFPPSTHTNFRQIKRAYKKTVQIIVDIIKSLKIYESKTSNLPLSPMPVIVEDELEQENLEDDEYDPNDDA
ncbi:unnamed protein product [Adineta steineri]|uniref:Uncharacterized protein n=1 Tax=Adineta steineri TaxID=433720 RepID=A0A818QL00_9BILA|nr:unnamed protein product [Adineta steineri]CAF3642975.1 unnamed protein product [Adineta steineri]